MIGRYPQAYFVSFLIHGAIIALVLLLGLYVQEHQPVPTKVFELVAGQGDNYAATEAPALGVTGGIGITAPDAQIPEKPKPDPIKVDIAQPLPEPTPPATVTPEPPVAVEPTPAPEVVPVPSVKPKPVVKTPAKKPIQTDFKKIVQSTAKRKAAKLESQYKKQQEKQLAAERKRESYEQFQREHGGSKAMGEGIAKGVVGGSTSNKIGGAGGKALTRDQQDLLDSYFAMFKARLKDNHLPPPGVSDRLEARVEFFMAADGSITRVHILRTSGNSEFDQSVLEAFAHTHMPSRPDHRSDMKEMTFKMHDEDAG
jgi:colicin import membrane protein